MHTTKKKSFLPKDINGKFIKYSPSIDDINFFLINEDCLFLGIFLPRVIANSSAAWWISNSSNFFRFFSCINCRFLSNFSLKFYCIENTKVLWNWWYYTLIAVIYYMAYHYIWLCCVHLYEFNYLMYTVIEGDDNP